MTENNLFCCPNPCHHFFSLLSHLTFVLWGGAKCLLFVLTFHAMTFNPAAAQQPGQCGAYVKEPPHPVWYLSNDSSDTYFDRFGNLYSRDEITTAYHPNAHSASCTNTGYFNLILEGNFTLQEEMTICTVFNFLYTLITPQAANPFVNIHVAKGVTQNALSLGEGSPIWSTQECGIANTLVQEGLYGNTSGVGLDHGFIRINSSIPWHTLDMDNTCPPNLVCPNHYDLYTVVLHEAFHILGFASNITVNGIGQGTPWTGNIFSRWDTYLYSEIQDRFLLKEVSINPECCDEHEFDNELFPMPATVNQVCASDIFFRVGGTGPTGVSIAEVNSDVLGANVPNILSHLPESCNNSGEYVMNPSLNTGADRRTPNPDEIEILCALGYVVAGGCATPPCTVSVGEDDPIIVELGATLPPFPSTDLTANDVPQGGAFTFSPISPCNDYPPGMVNYDNQTGMFTITGTQLGVYTFCYTFTGCGGEQCDEGEVTILVINPATNQCCSNNIGSCNINCLGDFETFSSSEDMQLALTGFPDHFFFVDQTDNTPDLHFGNINTGFTCDGSPITIPSVTGNSIGLVQLTPFIFEGVAFPLCEPVPIGKTATVSFRATTPNSCLPFNPRVLLEFSEEAPIGGQVIYVAPGVNSPQQSIPINTTEQTNPIFGQYTFTFAPNNSGVEWNFLVLSFRVDGMPPQIYAGQVFIDDVEVVIDKKVEDIIDVLINVIPNTPCLNGVVTLEYQICNTTGQISPELSFTATIPPGLTFVPTPDFPTLNIVRPAGWLLPNECKTITLAVKVDNDQALIGQTLPVSLTVGAGDCYQNLPVTSNITPIENPLSIAKTYTENPTTGVLTFTLDVSNSHTAPVGNVEVVDVLPDELDIVNPNGFTVNGNVLTQTVTIPPLSNVQLTFTAIRDNPCACANIQNCGIARITGSGCGDVADCIEVEGFSTEPDADFTIAYFPSDCHLVTFASSANHSCDIHTWDFGDGDSGTGAIVSHSYTNDGTYTVTHTVTNSCGTASVTSTVVIDCEPNFVCPCTGPDALNIDAGDAPVDPNQTTPGLSVINTPLSGGQPTQNSYNNNGRCIAICGHFLIDNNFTLDIGGGEIRMQPGAKIIIKNGATLNLKGVNGGSSPGPTQKGIHGCEQMWRSIVVEQGGKLNLSGNIIQDAEYAIDVKGGSNMPSFDASNNDFDRNHVSIRINGAVVQPLPFQKNKFRATAALLPVYSNGIANWQSLRSYTGMELSTTTFTVGIAGNPASENLFTGPGLRNGILAGGTYLNVYYAKFTQIWSSVNYNQASPAPPNSQGVGIYGRSGGKVTVHNSTFGGEGSNGWRAIYVGRCNLEAKWNDMYDITSGVYATPGGQATEITIQENKFRVTLPIWDFGQAAYVINNLSPGTNIKIINNNPIQIKGNGPAILLTNDPNNAGTTTRRVSGNYIYHSKRFYEGIKAENCSNWTIDGNHIFYSGFPSGTIFTQITRGIFLSNSDKCFLRDNEIRAMDGSLIGTSMHGIELLGSERCTLCCNLTDATTAGNFFMGNCDPAYLRHEQLYNHWIGLDCRDVGTVIGDQNWAGNQWLGTYGMLGAWHSGSDANIENSEFRVESPDAPPYWPPSRDPDPNMYPNDVLWFIPDEGGDSQNCSVADALCPSLPPPFAPNDPRDLTENERRIANGTYASAHVYDQTTQREGERSLYRKMRTNASLLGQDASVDQFFASASIGAIGQLYGVESQLQALGALPEIDRTRLLQIVHTLDSLAQVRNQIDQLYASAQNAADSTALRNWKTTCFAAARPLLAEWSEIRDDAEAALAAEIPGILALNNSIASSNTWVANRKTVNRIYLETIASGIDTATQYQISDLLAIANQCALEGGDAVLQARAVYNALAEEPLMFNDMEICDLGVGERSDKSVAVQTHTAHKVNTVPNPARDAFVLTVQGVNPGETLRLQIWDADGILEKELLVTNGAIVPTPFNPGLYFCRVYVGEEPADVVKLVIIP